MWKLTGFLISHNRSEWFEFLSAHTPHTNTLSETERRKGRKKVEREREPAGVEANSKHWFTTSFLPWRKVPESNAGSVRVRVCV